MADVIRLAPEDNVGVATGTLAQGSEHVVDNAAITVAEPIPFAHKVALQPIAAGAKVIKYGVPIGSAKVAIAAGSHVHVHNIKSDYVNNRADFYEDAGPAAGRDAR